MMLLRSSSLLTLALICALPLFADKGSTIAERASVVDQPKLTPINQLVGKKRPGFSFKDLSGKMRLTDEWNGKILIVNFWATWCPPCRKEMPAFVELQKKYGAKGLQFVGIALDNETDVKDFADNFEINYPILIAADLAGVNTAKAYGDHLGALPYTVIVDRQGIIQFVNPGEITLHQTEAIILKLL